MARQAPDGCLVPSEPFSEIVRDFVRSWNRERPQPGGQFGVERSVATPIRAIAWLAATASLPEATVQNVYEARFRRIELRVADALATALGRPEIFYDPRVEGQVVQNPFADAAARAACCGGSSLPLAV